LLAALVLLLAEEAVVAVAVAVAVAVVLLLAWGLEVFIARSCRK
jgi:hypothetical protein